METKVTWRNRENGGLTKIAGTIRFKGNLFTFTDESGEELIHLQPNEIDRFAAGIIGRNLLRYKVTTKSNSNRSYTFSKYDTGFQQFAYLLKNTGTNLKDVKFTDTGDWIKAFNSQGIQTRNYTYINAIFVVILAIIILVISFK